MANLQEKQAPINLVESPMLIDSGYNDDSFEEDGDTISSHCCWPRRRLYFIRRRNDKGSSHMYLLQQHKQEEEVVQKVWLVEKLKTLKEISEVLARPKWKKFIRRFNLHGSNKKRRMQFHYDSRSYRLNFDDGFDEEVDDNVVHPGFSFRLAAHVDG